MDALEFTNAMNEGKLEIGQLREAQLASQTAWEQLNSTIELKLRYQFYPDIPGTEPKHAILTYTSDCDWICDAVTGETSRLE